LNQVSLSPGGRRRQQPPTPGCLGCAGSVLASTAAFFGGARLRVELGSRFVSPYDYDFAAIPWCLLAAAVGLGTGFAAGARVARTLRAPANTRPASPVEWLSPIRGRWLRCLLWTALALLPVLVPSLALFLPRLLVLR
jgi:hypothetical protein